LGYSTSNIVNFDTFKKLDLDYLRERKKQLLNVPQIAFRSNPKDGIWTEKFFKKFGIMPSEFKGKMNDEGYLMPFGYDDAPERVRIEGYEAL